MSPGSRIHLYARACWPNVKRLRRAKNVKCFFYSFRFTKFNVRTTSLSSFYINANVKFKLDEAFVFLSPDCHSVNQPLRLFH